MMSENKLTTLRLLKKSDVEIRVMKSGKQVREIWPTHILNKVNICLFCLGYFLQVFQE